MNILLWHQKMFNIISLWGNVNQNHSVISLHTHENGYNQKDRQHQVLKGCKETGALENCRWEC